MNAIDELLSNIPWFTLRAKLALKPSQVSRIPAHQAALLYAMLCDAHARASGHEPAMPEGVLLNAPDQAVRFVSPEFPLTLGLTVIAPTLRTAHDTLQECVDGLRSLGREPAKGQTLRKFQIDAIDDLVAGRRVQTAGTLQPIARDFHLQQWRQLVAQGASSLTLVFKTPLRWSLPTRMRQDGHTYFDDQCFPAVALLRRVRERLSQLGMKIPDGTNYQNLPTSSHNELVWLDVGYGKTKDRTTLGGAVGSVRIDGLSGEDLAALVLGQIVRIGENTRFGFGEYHIKELGPEPFPILRTNSLLQIAIKSTDVAKVATEMNLPSGVLGQSLSAVENQTHVCDSHAHVEIPKGSGGTRTLSIPSLRDRAVQRVVLPIIAEGIDAFLESSAMAYRRGLGRNQAARKIRRAHQDGYAWAVKSDFFSFFDNVSHRLLRLRLDAYLADDVMVAWLMQAVEAGAPSKGIGLPTGSPLSPVLANLFLDQFDERIQATGARLVRYADDFLILCKTEEEAKRLVATAQAEAENLQLSLNRDKSSYQAINASFVFLGFKFSLRDQWEATQLAEPCLIEELEWEPAKKAAVAEAASGRLPGESEWETSFRQSTIIVGEDIARVRVESKYLVFEASSDAPPQRVATSQIRELIVNPRTNIDWKVLRELTERGCHVLSVDAAGRLQMQVIPTEPGPVASVLLAQVELTKDIGRRLTIAQELIASKLHNYAILSQLIFKRPQNLPQRLFELSRAASQANDLPQLLGYEGAGAALWYGRFAELLPNDFEFQRRVAPDASDPINVLLNIAQTVLHRWISLWCERAGLAATVGAMHEPRAGHASLASDLQEPFRHLMDHVVVQSLVRIRRTDFEYEPDGPFPLRMHDSARNYFLSLLFSGLSRSVAAAGGSEPKSYFQQARGLVFSFRAHLVDSKSKFRSFRHPGRP